MNRLRFSRLISPCIVYAWVLVAATGQSFGADETTAKVEISATAAASNPAPTVPSATAEPARADYYDVIFFARARPIFIRFHIEASQKRLSDVWQENVLDEFKYLDRDKSGGLDSKELGRSNVGEPQKSNENAVLKSIGAILGVGRSAAPAADPGSPVAFAERMQAAQPEFALSVSSNGETAADRLFATLDENGDGQISADEQDSGLARLTARDLDDDETLSLQELAVHPYPSLNFNNGFNLSGGEDDSGSSIRTARFVMIRTPVERQECAERWIRDYGKNGFLRSAADSPLAAVAQKAKTADASPAAPPSLGLVFLDAAALVEALKNPPIDMELLVRLGKKRDNKLPRVAFITADGAVLPKDARDIKFSSANGSRVFETATERVELVASNDNVSDDSKRQYKENFKQADSDNNKYVDKKESERYGNFSGNFAMIDSNDDEKIFEEEFDAWLDRQLASSHSRAVLSANDQGHPFFPLFDTNSDGRLGLRELRIGLTGLLSRDANGDGKLAEKELIHLYRLSVDPGQTNLTSAFGVFFYSGESDGRAKPTKGPEWFRNMDRNQDGDVSRREFLGSADNFKALDHDGDGLIDGKEAAVKKK
ncbi:MAG TPA: hypothetical protein VGJ26_00980 [Pirellulales bacterium]|jgi:Ca2+-binding EF-hand superfamily protein